MMSDLATTNTDVAKEQTCNPSKRVRREYLSARLIAITQIACMIETKAGQQFVNGNEELARFARDLAQEIRRPTAEISAELQSLNLEIGDELSGRQQAAAIGSNEDESA